MSSKKTIKVVFGDVWERVLSDTNIKNMSQLAKIVGTSQQNVSKRKKEGVFPVEWAFNIAQEYNLFTDWILTGTGPKSPADCNSLEDKLFQGKLAEWIKEESHKNPNFFSDFTVDCAVSIPEFAEWLKKSKPTVAQDSNSRRKVS